MTLVFVTIGFAGGVLSGLFGIGGGVVIVPALLLLAHMSPLTATGTSLGALLLPVGALGAWQYWRTGHLDVRASLLLALGLTAGAWIGARAAQQLPTVLLQRTFAVFLALIAVKLWTGAGK